jgi:hypothetical protein
MQSAKPFSTALQSGCARLAWYALWVAGLALLNACAPKYVSAPDSPMLIVQAKGSVLVAMRDGKDMVLVGWIDAQKLEGQTVVQFDWSERE